MKQNPGKQTSIYRDHRKEVLAALELFISPKGEQAAPELSRLWFDEVYVLSKRYVDTLKGDFNESLSENFKDSFDTEELLYLERFHRFFEMRLNILEKSAMGAEDLLGTESWENIRRDAKNTLSLLNRD